MAKKPHSIMQVVQSLGWPIFWGLTGFFGLLVCFEHEVVTNELVIRYATAHPVSYIVTAMFFVGAAALLLKASDVFGQIMKVGRFGLQPQELTGTEKIQLSDENKSISNVQRAAIYIRGLEDRSYAERSTYAWRRLRDVVESIKRGGANANPDEELKYLSDMDVERQQDGFALVRILIWATPMLGFLGTVIGISEALGGLSVGADQNFEQMMGGLRESLYVAFDTTALALTLSIVLMFGQFIVDRFETQLLAGVDNHASDEVGAHFDFSKEEVADRDPYLESVKRMSLLVLQSIEQISEKQASTWHQSIGASLGDWQRNLQNTNKQLTENMSVALSDSMDNFSGRMQQTMEEADARVNRRWEQWQVSMSENSRVLHRHQEEMGRQVEMLEQAIRASGDVMEIQDALNSNLAVLGKAESFEKMIVTLSAAINLLSTRLDTSQPTATVRFEPTRNPTDRKSRAA